MIILDQSVIVIQPVSTDKFTIDLKDILDPGINKYDYFIIEFPTYAYNI